MLQYLVPAESALRRPLLMGLGTSPALGSEPPSILVILAWN